MLNNKGSTLATVVIISSILLIFAVAFSTSVVADVSQSAKQQRNVEAHYIAMAGANATSQGILSMNELERKEFGKLAFPLTSNETPFEDGSFTVTINDYPDQIEIKSVGKVRDAEATVVRVIKKEVDFPYSGNVLYAIYSKNTIFTECNITGDIATCHDADGAIKFDWTAGFLGEDPTIVIPPGADPNEIFAQTERCKDFDKINIRQEELLDYPEPKLPGFPTNLQNKGSIIISGGSGIQTISGDGYYEKINVSGSKRLVIDTKGNTTTRIRVGELNLSGGGLPGLEIIGDGRVYIYIDNLQQLTRDVKALYPENVIFYIANRSVELIEGYTIDASLYFGSAYVTLGEGIVINGSVVISQGGSLNIGHSSPSTPVTVGVVYAPSVDVAVTNGANVKGAIIGNNIEVKEGSGIVYDGLGQITVPIETSDMKAIIYQEGYCK